MAAAEPSSAARLLGRLARPYDPPRAAAALLGLSGRAAHQVVGTIVATSAEAEHLLAAMPRIVRALAIATTDRPTRCFGEMRGPVLWAETMSARAASAGDAGLYVCATTTKAYDTEENRVLKAALETLARAGQEADPSHDAHDDDTRRARANGARAARFSEHQTLSAVTHKATRRARGRTRAGSRRGTYRPALDLLRLAADPLRPEHVEALADAQTRADHALLADVLDATERVLGAPPPLRTAHGSLVAGPVRYCHASRADAGDTAGVTVGGVVVASPDEVAGLLAPA